MRHALHATPRGFTADHPAHDVALTLGTALTVLEAVGLQFRDSAPSKAAATLVQSAIWLIAAKLEAQATALVKTDVPVAPPPRRTTAVVEAQDCEQQTWRPADTAEPQPANPPSAAHSEAVPPEFCVDTATSTPTQDTWGAGVLCAKAPPVEETASTKCRETNVDLSIRHTVAQPALRSAVADHHGGSDARDRPWDTLERSGNRSARVASDEKAPPDDYDGLCAVGARLFAAAAVKA